MSKLPKCYPMPFFSKKNKIFSHRLFTFILVFQHFKNVKYRLLSRIFYQNILLDIPSLAGQPKIGLFSLPLKILKYFPSELPSTVLGKFSPCWGWGSVHTCVSKRLSSPISFCSISKVPQRRRNYDLLRSFSFHSDQWFSKFSLFKNHQEDLLKQRLLRPIQSFLFSRSVVGLEFKLLPRSWVTRYFCCLSRNCTLRPISDDFIHCIIFSLLLSVI